MAFPHIHYKHKEVNRCWRQPSKHHIIRCSNDYIYLQLQLNFEMWLWSHTVMSSKKLKGELSILISCLNGLLNTKVLFTNF